MSRKSIKDVLLVEDNPADARLLREMFNEQGSHNTELTHVACMSEAKKHLAERAVDVIVLDLGLPSRSTSRSCVRSPPLPTRRPS